MEGPKCAKMRKEFKNAKAKHGLNSKIWIRLIGLSFFRDQKRREEEKRRGEEEEEEEEEEEKKKRRAKRYGIVWNLTLSMDYLDFLYGYMFVGCGL